MKQIQLSAALAAAFLVAVPAALWGQSDPAAGLDPSTFTLMRWDVANPDRVYAGTMGWGLVVSEDRGRTWSATASELAGRYVQSVAVHPLLPDRVLIGTRQHGAWLSTDAGRSFRKLGDELPQSDIPGVSIGVRIDAEADEARRRSYEARMRFSGRQPDPSKMTSHGDPSYWLLLRTHGPVRAGRTPGHRGPVITRMQPFHDLSVHTVRPDELLVAGRGRVARTVDGGTTWTPVLNPADGRFQASPYFLRGVDPAGCYQVPMRIHRQLLEPDLLWVAACYGLFHSRDGGASWDILPLGGFGRVIEVATDPTDASRLAVSTDLGVLLSRDAGATWEMMRAAGPRTPFLALTMGPGGGVLAGGFGGEVIEIDRDGMVEVRRLRELQATQRPDPEEEAERKARKSTAPYDRAGIAARPEAKPRLRPGIDVHVADLVAHPNFSDRLFAGTRRGVFYSEDGGETWRPSSLGLGELEVTDLLVDVSVSLLDAADPDPAGERVMLWAATRGGGIYRSTSTGKAWQPVNAGVADGVVRVLLQDSFEPHVLWAGTADDGVYRSRDAGQTWHAAGYGLGEWGIRVLAQSAGRLLAATDHGDLYESLDEGDSWQPRAGGLRRRPADTESDLQAFARLGLDPQRMHVHDLLVDEDDPDRLVAASSFGVFVSDDGGETWTWTRLRRGVARLARPSFDPDEIYAATTRGLWWSEDGGESWRQADFGRALNDLSLRGSDVDPTKAIRTVPPVFALTLLPDGEVLLGTDRGEIVRGSAEYGGWTVSHLGPTARVEAPRGTPAPRRPESVRETGSKTAREDAEAREAYEEGYEQARRRRDALLVASALAPETMRRRSEPRRSVLLTLEARRRGEVPTYPEEVIEKASPGLRAELQKEDVATRVLRLAQGDLRALRIAFLDGWGVENVRFGPEGRYLAVESAVDDGRDSLSEIRVYDLERRFLQGRDVYDRQGPTQYWKILHDLARKPQAAHPDWLMEDTGVVLLWRRSELLVTRPRPDRLAIWRLGSRPWEPSPTSEVRARTVHGFPLPVAAVSVSEDGRWLAAVDSSGAAFFVPLTGSHEPVPIEVPAVDGEEEPHFQQIHVTSKQLLLFGPSGIVAYRLGIDGPVLETPESADAGEQLFGPSAGFSTIVADRKGVWLAALPAPSDDAAQTLVFATFRDGLATRVLELASGVRSGWTATASAGQDWLAVKRASRDEAEAFLYDLRGLRDAPSDGQRTELQTESQPEPQTEPQTEPLLFLRVQDPAELRFGAGGGHVYLRADGEEQVWILDGPSPKRVELGAPSLHALETGFEEANPVAMAAWFFEGEPRMGDVDEWADYRHHLTHSATSPDGRWLAVAGPGRNLRLWHFDHDELGLLAPATGTTLLDLARFRPYPSNRPTNLDVWPALDARRQPPGSEELWRDACTTAGRNLDEAEWEYLFGEETWKPTCQFD